MAYTGQRTWRDMHGGERASCTGAWNHDARVPVIDVRRYGSYYEPRWRRARTEEARYVRSHAGEVPYTPRGRRSHSEVYYSSERPARSRSVDRHTHGSVFVDRKSRIVNDNDVDQFVDHHTKRLLDFGHISDPTVIRLRTEGLSHGGLSPYEQRHGRSTSVDPAARTLLSEDEEANYERQRASRKLHSAVEAALKRKVEDVYAGCEGKATSNNKHLVHTKRVRQYDSEVTVEGPRGRRRYPQSEEDALVQRALSHKHRSTSLCRLDDIGTAEMYDFNSYQPCKTRMRKAVSELTLGGCGVNFSELSPFAIEGNGHFAPDEVEVVILPSGRKAIQYSSTCQSGTGNRQEQNAVIQRVIEKTRFMQQSMTKLEEFVRRNRSMFPDDTRIYQRIRFFLLTEEQLIAMGESPDAEVYGIKIVERLVVPYGTDVVHILQRCYGKSDVQIEIAGTQSFGDQRYSSVTTDVDTSYRHLHSQVPAEDMDTSLHGLRTQARKDLNIEVFRTPRKDVDIEVPERRAPDVYRSPRKKDLDIELPECHTPEAVRSPRKKKELDIGLPERRTAYEELADRHISYSNDMKRKRSYLTDNSLKSTGQAYDDIFTPRKTSYASSVASEDSARSSASSRRRKRFDTAPSFTSKLRPKRCNIGGMVRFNCSISGLPMPDVQWFKGNRVITHGGRFNITNNYGLVSLEINDVTKDDAGLYTIKATNLEGEVASSGGLEVLDDAVDISKSEGIQRPWFTCEVTNVYAEEGNKATLEAQATGRPLPSFKWMKDSVSLVEDARIKFFEDDRGNAKLIIRDVKETDSGLYSCVADNKAGKCKCTASLKVVPHGQLSEVRRRSRSRETTPVASRRHYSRETTPVFDLGPGPEKGQKPYFIQTPTPELIVRHEETMTLKCVVDGDPKPYVTWMKGARELTYTEHMRVVNEGDVHILQIARVLDTDRGEYVAVAFNPLGKVKASCFVNIKPKLPEESDDWELKTYKIDVPDVSIETTTSTETSNVPPHFVKRLPLETTLQEHENLEIKCKTEEAPPDVHVTKDYHMKVTGDLALEETTRRISKTEDGEEKVTIVDHKVTPILTGDKPSGPAEPAAPAEDHTPVDAVPEQSAAEEPVEVSAPENIPVSQSPEGEKPATEPEKSIEAVLETPVEAAPTPDEEKPSDEKKKKKKKAKDEPEAPKEEDKPAIEKPVEEAAVKPAEETSVEVAPGPVEEKPVEEKKKKKKEKKPKEEPETAKEDVKSEQEPVPEPEKPSDDAHVQPAAEIPVEAAPVPTEGETVEKKKKKKEKKVKDEPAAPIEETVMEKPAPNVEAAPEPLKEESKPEPVDQAIEPAETPVVKEPPTVVDEELIEPSAKSDVKSMPPEPVMRESSPEPEPSEPPTVAAPVEDKPIVEEPIESIPNLQSESAAPVIEVSKDKPTPEEPKEEPAVQVPVQEAPKEDAPKAPAFESELPDIVGKVGETITFTLVSTAYPAPDSIKWFKDGKRIEPSEHYLLIVEHTTYTLKIVNVTVEDTGMYSCTVMNDHGMATSTGSLKLPESATGPDSDQPQTKSEDESEEDTESEEESDSEEESVGAVEKAVEQMVEEAVSEATVEASGLVVKPKVDIVDEVQEKVNENVKETPEGEASGQVVKPKLDIVDEVLEKVNEDIKETPEGESSGQVVKPKVDIVDEVQEKVNEDVKEQENSASEPESSEPESSESTSELEPEIEADEKKPDETAAPLHEPVCVQDDVEFTNEGEVHTTVTRQVIRFAGKVREANTKEDQVSEETTSDTEDMPDGGQIRTVIVKKSTISQDGTQTIEIIKKRYIKRIIVINDKINIDNIDFSFLSDKGVVLEKMVEQSPEGEVQTAVTREVVSSGDIDEALVLKRATSQEDKITEEVTSDTEDLPNGGSMRTVIRKKTVVSPDDCTYIETHITRYIKRVILIRAEAIPIGPNDKVSVDTTSDTEDTPEGDKVRTVVETKTITSPNGSVRIEKSTRRFITKKTTVAPEVVPIGPDDKVSVETTSDNEETLEGDKIRTVVEKRTITSPNGSVRVETATKRYITRRSKVPQECVTAGSDDKVSIETTSDTEETPEGDNVRTVVEKKTITAPDGSMRVETSKKRFVTKKSMVTEESVSAGTDDKVSVETTSDTEETPEGDTVRIVIEKRTITSPNGSVRMETNTKRYVTKKCTTSDKSVTKTETVKEDMEEEEASASETESSEPESSEPKSESEPEEEVEEKAVAVKEESVAAAPAEEPVCVEDDVEFTNDGEVHTTVTKQVIKSTGTIKEVQTAEDRVSEETTSDTEDMPDGGQIHTVIVKKTTLSPDGSQMIEIRKKRYIKRIIVPSDKVNIDNIDFSFLSNNGVVLEKTIEQNSEGEVQTAVTREVVSSGNVDEALVLKRAISQEDKITEEVVSDTEDLPNGGSMRTVIRKKTVVSPDNCTYIETHITRHIKRIILIKAEAIPISPDDKVSVETTSDTEDTPDGGSIRTVVETKTITSPNGSIRKERSTRRFITKKTHVSTQMTPIGSDDKVSVETTSDTEETPKGDIIRTVTEKRIITGADGSVRVETSKKRFVSKKAISSSGEVITKSDASVVSSAAGEDNVSVETTSDTEETPEGDIIRTITEKRTITGSDGSVRVETSKKRFVSKKASSSSGEVITKTDARIVSSAAGEEDVSVETTSDTEETPEGDIIRTVTEKRTITGADGSVRVEVGKQRFVTKKQTTSADSKAMSVRGDNQVSVETTSDTEVKSNGDKVRTVVEKRTITSADGSVRVETSTKRFVTRSAQGRTVGDSDSEDEGASSAMTRKKVTLVKKTKTSTTTAAEAESDSGEESNTESGSEDSEADSETLSEAESES